MILKKKHLGVRFLFCKYPCAYWEWFLEPSEVEWHKENLQMVPFVYFPFIKDADFDFHVFNDPVKYFLLSEHI